MIAPVVSPVASASSPAVVDPAEANRSMHLWSVGFSPSRSATAWWNRIVAMLSRRPACCKSSISPDFSGETPDTS